MFGAIPQAMDAVVNTAMPTRNTPSTAVEIGSRAPDQHQRAEQQEVGVDDPLRRCRVACRACWIAGSAIFTTERR